MNRDGRRDTWRPTSDVETLALVDTLAHTLGEAEASTVDNTLVGVKAKALINKLAMTLLEAEHLGTKG